jgi:hypothetical protein
MSYQRRHLTWKTQEMGEVDVDVEGGSFYLDADCLDRLPSSQQMRCLQCERVTSPVNGGRQHVFIEVIKHHLPTRSHPAPQCHAPSCTNYYYCLKCYNILTELNIATGPLACAWCGDGKDGNLRVCGACKHARYCCKEHQVLHWKQGGHKAECAGNARLHKCFKDILAPLLGVVRKRTERVVESEAGSSSNSSNSSSKMTAGGTKPEPKPESEPKPSPKPNKDKAEAKAAAEQPPGKFVWLVRRLVRSG